MTLKVWLVFFILSMAVNAQVLAWAVRSGQFTNVNRGNAMPLRQAAVPIARRQPRRWAMPLLLASLAVMVWAWGAGMLTLVAECFRH